MVVSPVSILLVDYVDDERGMYAEGLRAAGFSVDTCRDAGRALERAVATAPRVVVTRVRQPADVDGIELARQFKADARTRTIVVVVITSHIGPELRARSARSGCDALLCLPCLPEELVETIRSLLPPSSQEGMRSSL